MSIAAALAFRWDGRRTRLYFQTRPATYTDGALITFLRTVKRHFRGQRVVLLWDGLGAHKSHRMTTYLAAQHQWLHVEPLPAYAPDLNPVELLWGNLKARELANLCPADVLTLRRPIRSGCARVRSRPHLAFAFLKHAGLSL
jgi:transposase